MSDSDAWTTFLLRYGEIGIKSPPVRRQFEDQLEANLRAHFVQRGATALIDRERGRFYLDTPDAETARDVISHTFGLVHGSPVVHTQASLDAIGETVRALASDTVRSGESFAIRARRTGNHAFTSMDVGVRGGDVVLEEVPDAEVDLDDPDKELHVEVRNADAYVFTEFIQAPGGLPMGSQGRVVVPFEEARSPAAAWLMMRRGADVHVLVPQACEALVDLLTPWAPGLDYTVLPASVSREGLRAAAGALADQVKADAVALGEHEASAQETQPDTARGWAVLRPLAGLPGKRWPRPAYRLSKRAAEEHPSVYTETEGMGPQAAVDALKDAKRKTLPA